MVALKSLLLLIGLACLFHWAWQERSLESAQRWNAYLLLGVVLSQLAAAIFSLRFRQVMRIVGLHLSVVEALRINTLSMFYQFFVPLSAGADLTKFVKLRALAPERRLVVTAAGILLEHCIGLATLVVIATGVMLFLRPIDFDIDMSAFAALAAAATLAAALVGLRLHQRARRALDRLARQLRLHKADVAVAMGLSLLMQLLLAGAVFAGALGWDIPISYAQVLFVLAVSFVFHGVPAGIVGIGVADLAGTGLYVALGLPLPAAVLLVSLLYCYRILVALIGGAWDLIPARPLATPASVDA